MLASQSKACNQMVLKEMLMEKNKPKKKPQKLMKIESILPC